KDANGDYLKYPESAGSSDYFTEYEVGKTRISGSGKSTVVLGIIHAGEGKFCALGSNPNLTLFDMILEVFSPTGKAIFNAKSSAVYDAVTTHNADYLVGTMFSYAVHNYLLFTVVNCNITAFPAKVKKISPAKKIILDKDQRLISVNPDADLEDFSYKKSLISLDSPK
ncbi:MAG: hypothetical protein IKB22_04800, partial [Lentisphaeria bacterium]|nr:hypothetical protein [Lentisphaeria bacterium]